MIAQSEATFKWGQKQLKRCEAFTRLSFEKFALVRGWENKHNSPTVNICDEIVNWVLPGQSCQSRQRGQGCFSWSAARSASVRRAGEPQVSALGARSLPERESLLICLFATSSWSLWKINLSNLKFNSRVSQENMHFASCSWESSSCIKNY